MTAVQTMLPLADWPLHVQQPIAGVLTDIDDTLTRDGAIEPVALQALHRLHDAGVPVLAITGRPSGWSEPFALAWPVHTIVAENGALRLFGNNNALHKKYIQTDSERMANFRQLQAVLAHIEREVPGAQRAGDSAGRETDIAVDHSEFTHLPAEQIGRVVDLMRAGGLTATVSSIHINGWIGSHNKWTGALWAVQDALGKDLRQELDHWVYVGDSTNDQVMFQHMPLTVGVANIRRFVPGLSHLPRFVAGGERGEGFAQVAEQVLQSRRQWQPAPSVIP